MEKESFKKKTTRKKEDKPEQKNEMFRKTRLKIIDHGDPVRFNGKNYNVVKLENPLDLLRKSKELKLAQRRAYLEVIEALSPIKYLTNQIAAKQFSPNSLDLINWIDEVLKAVPEKQQNEKILKQLSVYQMFLSKNLLQYSVSEKVKYTPYFTREELKSAIESIDDTHAETRKKLLDSFWVNAERIFSVGPMSPNANLFRFKTKKDRQIFFEGLGVEYKELQRSLQEAVEGFRKTPTMRMTKIAGISYKMNKIQEEAMREQIKEANGEHDSKCDTIVYMHYEDGKMKTETRTYAEEFKQELEEISKHFKKASELAKKVSPELSEQLAFLADAAVTGNYEKADKASYEISSKESYIDVGFECKETYCETVLGRKGLFSFRVSIKDEEKEPIIEKIRKDERFKTLNIERWHNIIVAGFGSQYMLLGQKLPNEEGQKLYKDVILMNALKVIQSGRMRLAPRILALKNEKEDMERIMAAVYYAILFHELGHVYGTSVAPHLNLNNPTEECQAEARLFHLAEEMTPEHMRGLVLRTVALAPIWMMSGLGGAHQKADVYIVGRLMEEGAVWINNEKKLEVDVEKAVPIIKRIADECKILERPKTYLEEAEKLLAKELSEVGDIEKAAGKRAESMFGKENIDKIAEKLKPVAEPIMDEPIQFVYYAYLSGNLMNQKI